MPVALYTKWVALPAATVPQLVITTTSLPSTSVGLPYSASVAAVGGVPPYTWSFLSVVPNTSNWLSISSTTGALSGTAPSNPENEAVLVQVQDSLGTKASAPMSIAVGGNPLVILTSSPLPGSTTGTAYSVTFTAQGGSAPYTWSLASASPNTGGWMSMSSGGVLTGTPGTAESESLTARVQDSIGTVVTKSFALTVSAPATLAFPRIMGVFVGGDQSYGSTATTGWPSWTTATAGSAANIAIQKIGAYDIAILNGSFEGWDSSGQRDRENLTQALLKNATYSVKLSQSRQCLPFYYQMMMSGTPTGSAYQQYFNIVQANNWWLYESTGGTGTITPAGGGANIVNYSTAWPAGIGSALIGQSICGANYGALSSGSPTGQQGPARTMGNYVSLKYLIRSNSGIDPRFSFNPQMASPSCGGIFLDNCFIALDGAGPVPNSSLDGISIAPGSQVGVFPSLDTVQPVMARGNRNMFDQMQVMATTYQAGSKFYNFANFGHYANKYQFGTATVTAGLDNLQGGLLENVVGYGAGSWECYQVGNPNTGNTTYASGWPNLRDNYYQGMDLCLPPKLVGLGAKLPSTDGAQTAQWPVGAGTTLSAVTTGTTREYQLMRYGLCTALLDDGYFAPGVNGYDYATLRWYDEYGDDSLTQVNVKRGYLGTPLTVRPTTPTWAQGTLGVWSRSFTNGMAIVNPRGNGAQTVTLPQSMKTLSGTQQPSINNGATVSSVSLADGDGIILLNVASLASAPLILGVDCPSGPTTGGEFGLGAFLNIYGVFPGAYLNSDGTTNVAVTIGGKSVANFRCVVQPVVSGQVGVAGQGLNAIIRIGCQIGPLTGLAQNGTYYPIVVTIGGVAPRNKFSGGFYLDLDNNPIGYCPNPGPIKQVDIVNGSDSNSGNWGSPYQHFQTYNGSSFGAALFGTAASGAAQSSVVQPGTHIYAMATGLYQTLSLGNRVISVFRMTGTAPNGATPTSQVVVNGVSCIASGYIHVASYPGPINGNAPHRCYNNGVGSSSGFYNGPDTARTTETTPWGFSGYGQYFSLNGFQIDVPAGAPSDAAPINIQNGSNYIRITDCLCGPWNSNIEAFAGGIAGYGTSPTVMFNWCKNITSATGQENHGHYIENSLGGYYAYNLVTGTTGNGMMIRGTGLTSETSAQCISVHHNWLDCTVGKHCFDLPDNRLQAYIWNNVCINGEGGLVTIINSGVTSVNNACCFINNTVYGWRTYGGMYTADPSTYHKNYINNVFLQISGQPAPGFSGFFNAAGANNQTFTDNIYYDPNGYSTTVPSGDTTGRVANPLLTNVAAQNFVPGANSPAVNFGQTPDLSGLVTVDFNFLPRPQGANAKITAGAFERPGG